MTTQSWRLLAEGPRSPGPPQEVVDLGSGSAVLFIHGDLFEEWFLPVARDPALDGFRRILARRAEPLDVLGPPPTMSDHAAAFVEVLDALGLSEVHVCGHSFGALVALELAAGDHRRRVRSLVLLEPAAAGALTDVDEDDVGRQILGPIMGAAAAGDLEAAYEGFVNAVGRADHREVTARAIGEDGVTESVRRARSLLALGGAAGQWQQELDEERIEQPVLLIAGARSAEMARYAPPTVTRLAELLPHAQVFEIPRGTHLMTLEEPSAVADQIADFARRVEASHPSE